VRRRSPKEGKENEASSITVDRQSLAFRSKVAGILVYAAVLCLSVAIRIRPDGKAVECRRGPTGVLAEAAVKG